MGQPLAFANRMDAAEQLDSEAQMKLVAILHRRPAEKGRQRVAAAAEEFRREFATSE